MKNFLLESNRIEGIFEKVSTKQVELLEDFVWANSINVVGLGFFVREFQPDAVLRNKVGLDVQVGRHLPPLGGPEIVPLLEEVLELQSPFDLHLQYETLHPFTDGNGRSGRALWLRAMRKKHRLTGALKLGFLHSFYYQTLEELQ